MDDAKVMDKIEKLTEVLFCAESSGTQTLDYLRQWFREIRQWAVQNSRPEIERLAQAAANVLEEMIYDKLFFDSLSSSHDDPDLDALLGDGGASGMITHTQDEIKDMLMTEMAAHERNFTALGSSEPSYVAERYLTSVN